MDTKSPAARLPKRDSYPLSEIATAWKHAINEDQLVDCIRFGELTCGVLLQEDRPVKVHNRGRRLGEPRYAPRNASGYNDLLPVDAVAAYHRVAPRRLQPGTIGPFVDQVTNEDQRIAFEEPYGKAWVTNWLATRYDLRITDKERARFAGKHGIADKVLEQSLEPSPTAANDSKEKPKGEDVFRRKNRRFWQVAYKGKHEPVPHSKGMLYIAYLLQRPDHEVLATDLVDAAAGLGLERSSGTEMMDQRAKDECRKKLHELKDELEEARGNNDRGSRGAAREREREDRRSAQRCSWPAWAISNDGRRNREC